MEIEDVNENNSNNRITSSLDKGKDNYKANFALNPIHNLTKIEKNIL